MWFNSSRSSTCTLPNEVDTHISSHSLVPGFLGQSNFNYIIPLCQRVNDSASFLSLYLCIFNHLSFQYPHFFLVLLFSLSHMTKEGCLPWMFYFSLVLSIPSLLVSLAVQGILSHSSQKSYFWCLQLLPSCPFMIQDSVVQ